METLRAPSGASRALARSLDLAGGAVQSALERLDTSDQNLFWSELEEFAAAQIGHKTSLPLVVREHIPIPVRERLREVETGVAKALHGLSGPDRNRFWPALRDSAAEQAAQTSRPRARAGGGPFSF